ncbi:MAG: PAS domain-containing sensor histidine kinase [Anaerolineales bacterium]|nr:PAS domain-containing sensor histidine kinase [Anaerolineales bacterium]
MDENSHLADLYSRHWPVFLALVTAFYIFWIALAPETMEGSMFPAVLVFGVRLMVAWAAAKALPGIHLKSAQRSWRLLAVALLIWATADALAVLLWILRGQPLPSPSLRELFVLAGYLAALTAFITYPTEQPGRFGRLREALDLAILIISVLAISWLLFLGTTFRSRTLSTGDAFWLSVLPTLDLILLVLALRLFLLRKHPQERWVFPLIAIASIVLFISDLGNGLLRGDAQIGMPSLVEAGWMAGAVLFGISYQILQGRNADYHQEVAGRMEWRLRIELLLPIAFTYAVVGYIIFDWWYIGVLDWVGISAAGLLVLLLVARQGVVTGQQEMLQFAALINATTDLAFICTTEGDIRLSNPALRNAVGDGKDQNVKEFLHIEGDEIALFDAILERAFDGGWSGEVAIGGKDASRFPAHLTLSPIEDARGLSTMLAGTAYDLTTIREREIDLRKALGQIDHARNDLASLNAELENKVEERTRELENTVADLERLNEELKTLDSLKSEFVALVSHELRAPLTNIRGGIELVLKRRSNLGRKSTESLQLVQTEIGRLTHFVETILDLSALEAGRFQLALSPLSISDILERTIARFPGRTIKSRLKTEIEEGLDLVVADKRALDSVFFHLLDNAAKYAPSGDISIEAREEPGRVVITVSDSGPGIPADQREQVFEMFHRLDTSDAREVYGHGLGLPMVSRLLEAMGGGIRVDEKAVVGTRLEFWLPTA